MKLSDMIDSSELLRDAEFQDLGYSHDPGYLMLTFCDNIYYLNKVLANSSVSAIITNPCLVDKVPEQYGLVVSNDPRNTFFDVYVRLLSMGCFHFCQETGMGENCKIAKSALISPNTFIGDNVIIGENVVIHDNVIIGDGTRIESGAVVGAQGILYVFLKDRIKFVEQVGGVVLGKEVTLLANSVVARSIFPNAPTRIDDYALVGISSNIGHDSHIGESSRILGNCVVAKSAKVGKMVAMGTSSVIRENITIGDYARVQAGSIVVEDVGENMRVSGNFAMDHNKHMRNFFKAKKE